MGFIVREKELYLSNWYKSANKKPLLLRGSRQVGKSQLVRNWAKENNLDLIEINLEEKSSFRSIFEKDLDAERMLSEISLLTAKNPRQKNTIVFIDEIQAVPRALIALRYFYENTPEVSVIAAGSLIEFILEEVGFPVGRIESLYIHPLSFFEFLTALDRQALTTFLLELDLEKKTLIPEAVHQELLQLLKEYYRVGGMPKVVATYVETRDYSQVSKEQEIIIRGYKDDFIKYAKKAEWQILHSLMNTIGQLIGRTRVKYNSVGEEYTSMQVKNGLQLLNNSQIVNFIYSTHTKKLPLAAHANYKFFKLAFLDIGLLHYLLGFDWNILTGKEDLTDICEGRFAEQFVAQELLVSRSTASRYQLHYWDRPKAGSDAEVDYVIEHQNNPCPLEVKSGVKGRLKSLKQYCIELEPAKAFVLSQRNIEHVENFSLLPLYLASKL